MAVVPAHNWSWVFRRGSKSALHLREIRAWSQILAKNSTPAFFTSVVVVPEIWCAVVVAVGSLRGAAAPAAECVGPPPLVLSQLRRNVMNSDRGCRSRHSHNGGHHLLDVLFQGS